MLTCRRRARKRRVEQPTYVDTNVSTKRQITARIVRVSNEDERLVTAVVYAPNQFDTYGEFMLPEDVEKLAHRTMRLDLANLIDTNHDNVPNGCFPVESYIAKKNDPEYPEGAWVMTVKVTEDLWPSVLSGETNGFSFEAMVELVSYDVEATIQRDHVGRTLVHKGDDHDHVFFVQVNEKGKVVSGRTSPGPDGHTHVIRHGTFTEAAKDHSHRFSLMA